jgi:hypothetical protein
MKPSELLQTNDALVWAEEFERLKTVNNWTLEDIDSDMMLGWFANAMAAQEFTMLYEQEQKDKAFYKKFMQRLGLNGVSIRD